MKKKPKRKTGGGTRERRRLKPLNNFAAMERLIAATEESAHLQGMSIFHMLIAANAMTAAALRQIMALSDSELLAALHGAGQTAAADNRHAAKAPAGDTR